MSRAVLILCLSGLSLIGCDGRAAPEPQTSISYKTRADNAPVSVERTHRLSETETIKVVIVPGFPYYERCVIYTNGQTSAMQCRDVSAGQR